ncbi:hypothetical protein [Klebsiella variicola]|uniref:hypothetical protein n=1 Tax=Klebsiella variicola TaxID=244366 RepID=UPI0032D9E4C5|nr:hypothetical protein [Klebsiella variicola]
MSNQGLSINVDAVWDDDCIIGSSYPQPSIASIATFGSQNFGAIFGEEPTIVGAPVINTYWFTGGVGAGGYDLKVTDNPVKTMMVLLRPKSTTRALGMGNYLGSAVQPQGDTFVFEPAIPQIRGIVGRSSGTATATLATPLDTSKFHLVFLDVNNSMVQLHKMTNSELLSTEQVAVTARAIPVPNKSIYAGYSYITSDFLGAVDIAMTGVWAGGILSQAEKMDMADLVTQSYEGILSIA